MSKRTSKPAATPESREKQLTELAVNLAEKQLIDGTAPPSIINHYLKIASTRESIERDILEKQAQLISAKAQSIVKSDQDASMAQKVVEVMTTTYKSQSD